MTIQINDIDTDQIIPARFLKVTDKKGLGDVLFCDWRYHSDGSPKADFVLNRPEARGAAILVAGDNFGCGSSREHAPWALTGYGFRAIISTSFADIFRSNALKNSLLPVIVDAGTLNHLFDLHERKKNAEIRIDLPAQIVVLPDGRQIEFPIDEFSKTCLLEGIDQLGYLQKFTAAVQEYEKRHPARVNTLAS
ncbi:3-isopropylmalate dehydratase small subunit [candidate division KSB1 bacterium]|nr:3-isopropylmalate dehydratase small subunit [candidate division KSB1 bacterium]